MPNELKIYPEKSRRTTSTILLTPKNSMILKRILRRRRMSLPEYFDHLIQDYNARIVEGRIKPSTGSKRQYQLTGPQYWKRNFRPANSSWAIFTELSRHLNWSNCLLFATLLRMDWKKQKAKAINRIGFLYRQFKPTSLFFSQRFIRLNNKLSIVRKCCKLNLRL